MSNQQKTQSLNKHAIPHADIPNHHAGEYSPGAAGEAFAKPEESFDPQLLKEYFTNEQMLNQCFTRVLSADSLDDSLNGILAQVGKYLDADRCYIFKYCRNRTIVKNTHEWTGEAISPEIAELQNVPAGYVSDWTAEFLNKKAITCSDLHHPEKYMEKALPILLPQRIRSLQVCGIWLNNQLWGFIGIDYVRHEHIFTARSLWAISSVANLIGLTLAKENSAVDLRDSIINKELMSHLTQSSYFKMDPVSRKILQSGRELAELLPLRNGCLPQPEVYVHPDDLDMHTRNQHAIYSGQCDLLTWNFRMMREDKCRHMHICVRFVRDRLKNPFVFAAVQDVTDVVDMADQFSESMRQELLKSHDLNEQLQKALAQNLDFVRQDDIIKQCYSRLLLTDTLVDACREVTQMLGGYLNNTIINISRYRTTGRPRLETLSNKNPVPDKNISFEFFYEDQYPLLFRHLKAGNMVHCHAADFERATFFDDWREEIRNYFVAYQCQELYCLPLMRGKKFWGYMAAEVHHPADKLGSRGERILNSALRMFEILISRMENRELLLRMEAEQQLMLDILPIPIVLLEPDTTILHCNRAFDALVDIKTSLNGLNCRGRICRSDCSPPLCPVLRTMEKNEPQCFEKYFRGHNYLVKTMPLKENGLVIKIIVAYIDLTEIAQGRALLQEALIKAKEAARAKSIFLATMSHEIRTPLNSIIGFSELLQDASIHPEECAEYLQAINVSGNALLHLVNDILDLSKAEADQRTVAKTPINIRTMLHELRSIFSQKLAENHLNFKINADGIPNLMLDGPHIRQILLNLIGNAVKFTVHGEMEVKVTFVQQRLTIAVRDSGCGISQQGLQSIFEPFVQDRVFGGSPQVMPGTGLGLPIVKRLVENMSGTIAVESTLGQGTCFTIELPDIDRSQEERGAKAENDPETITSGTTVLIVDDVPMNLKILSAMLKKIGCEVIAESNPETALSKAATECPALIMTDMWMPVLNGAQLAARIKKLPECAHIPIIAVTADNASETNFDTSYFDDILLKPIDIKKLTALLSRYRVEPSNSDQAGRL